MKIVLYHPQIPQNTGNIVRTCHATQTELILVRPLGFKTDDKSLRRAGLDYWEGVPISFIDDLSDYLKKENSPFYFFSSHAQMMYTEASYSQNTLLIFGSETSGLPAKLHKLWPKQFRRIPMQKNSRCLNLSNAVAIVLYEALRQQHFPI